uniref:Choline/carnitine acyltransferase domain-containing protein n=1 Tax=Acrobeloides nanus TaxID=290746 RepID=A0A914CUY3_9BILA
MTIQTTNSVAKPVRPPFSLDAKYPTALGRWTTQFYNSTFNRLYPVKPWIFATTAAGSFAYYSRFPKSWILSAIPDISKSELARYAKIGLISLFTAYIPVFLLRKFLRHFYFSYKGFLFENPKKPSWKTKVWAACHQLLKILAPPRLNSCDALLPPQPVPALKDTIEEYLNTIEPIVSKDEYDSVKTMAKKFLHEEGSKLQVYVTLYSYFTDNYVTPFWEKYAYWYGREPLLISSSVAHVDLIEDKRANQAVRAAHVVYIEALSMLSMYNQTLKPLGDGIVCSSHYKKTN